MKRFAIAVLLGSLTLNTLSTANAAEGNTVQGVTLKNYELGASEGGLLVMGKFTIVNTKNYAIKDLSFECEIFAESGTKVATLSATALRVVEASKTRTLTKVEMGLKPRQIAKYTCELKDWKF